VFNAFSLLARLPLRILHGLGAVFGCLAFRLDARYARRCQDNLRQSKLAKNEQDYNRLLRSSIQENGKGAFELIVSWFRPAAQQNQFIQELIGWDIVEAAQKSGKGIIFISPHLGGFEIVGGIIAQRLPVLPMFRPPNHAFLQKIMLAGRKNYAATLAPATLAGVRMLLKCLKKGGNIAIFPDQVPSQGEGVWANFFGQPAYTMTLIPRLQQATGASILLYSAYRLPKGRGYRVQFSAFTGTFSADAVQNATLLNQHLELLISQSPEQYLWGYNRYKCPAGVIRPAS
jgi:KDO2-lipid IV(A) lauroyltransferase